jgi:uncharacterized protein YigA (DUF484 family)
MGQLINTFCGYTVSEIKNMEKKIAELESNAKNAEYLIQLIHQKSEQILQLSSGLEMALEACYELDSYGVKDENLNYLTASETTKRSGYEGNIRV